MTKTAIVTGRCIAVDRGEVERRRAAGWRPPSTGHPDTRFAHVAPVEIKTRTSRAGDRVGQALASDHLQSLPPDRRILCRATAFPPTSCGTGASFHIMIHVQYHVIIDVSSYIKIYLLQHDTMNLQENQTPWLRRAKNLPHR